jgi:hypothetical protein
MTLAPRVAARARDAKMPRKRSPECRTPIRHTAFQRQEIHGGGRQSSPISLGIAGDQPSAKLGIALGADAAKHDSFWAANLNVCSSWPL